MEKRSDLRSAIEELSTLPKVEAAPGNLDAAPIPTKPFPHVCNLILQVLGQFLLLLLLPLPDMWRLEVLCESNPTKYSNMIEILKNEDSEGNARDSTSCSRAILWLTRSIDFMVVLLQRLVKDPWQEMERAVEESYNVTLKQWHGWVSTAAFKISLKYYNTARLHQELAHLNVAGSLSSGPVEVYLRRIYGDQEGKDKQTER
ncbi:hypothetical protein F3Y22_tig00110457pilonHSYRG00068 [Hibiscus syriacus]|uniref:Glycolipid transfer protein domain-containing protein n=1 Tax=Hibiscus syriacus TaxID=106335 RepID=A0A6A3ALU6_HIBSY|nr:hypothetical protein F3Y22_tig00110457pilonHSYRG00068 [Hibiscus syriacus]